MSNYAWSQHYWYVLESLTRQIGPEDDIDEIRVILYGIGKYLPCMTCREHFKEFVESFPLDKDNVKRWVFILKNKVLGLKTGCCGRNKVSNEKNKKTPMTKRLQQLGIN
jgi:hypothetical protein